MNYNDNPSYYEDCAFEYVNQFDTPACDMQPGSDTRYYAEDFLKDEEQYPEYN